MAGADRPRTADTRVPLVVGVVAISVSAALLARSGEAIDSLGYLLATIIGGSALMWYGALTARRRTGPSVVAGPRRAAAYGAVLLIGFVAGITIGAVHVWRLADALAR